MGGGKKIMNDITIVNRLALLDLNVEDWEVLDHENFSDHKYISYSVGQYTPFKREFRNLESRLEAL